MVMLVAHIFPKDHVPKCGTGSKEAEPVPDIPTIMETFEEEYRESLQALPAELFPQGIKHGKHSYTLQPGCNLAL